MTTEPTIAQRDTQPYVGITERVTIQNIGMVLPEVHSQVFEWLGERGIEQAGAPFWKYNVIDMATEMEVEVGVPITNEVTGDERVKAGVLPAGRYATVTHIGHPQELMGVTGELLKWGDQQGVTWDMTETPAGQKWACRLEIYHTDPREQPDMSKWETDLAFKLAE